MMKLIIRVLSFDPGLTCTGWALSEYNIQTGEFHVLKRGRIEGKKALMKNKELLAIYTKRLVQLNTLNEAVMDLARNNPDFIVTEDAFHQPGRTSAFIALTLCIHEIEKAVQEKLNRPVFKLAPKHVKRLSAQVGDASKLTVQEQILENKNIILKETKQNPIDRMTEHEADAIAVGYAFVIETLISRDHI